MVRKKAPPEITFQQHVAHYLVREHTYGVLEQSEITDSENFICEDHLWSFLKATQGDTLKKLEEDYGTDSREEVFKALRKELARAPLWMIMRDKLQVRGLDLLLFIPKPRSMSSAATVNYDENRITFRPHLYFGETNQEIDFVFFLNGLPIVDLELKHEKNQNVHDAVAQYVARDHEVKIFQHPFLYLAADTSDVMAATDPSQEGNFRWHNTGLTNKALNPKEYPVEFLYRDVLSKDQLLEALSFYLVYFPKREAEGDKPERPAETKFPRYHQSRLVRRVSQDITSHFTANADIGKKYLADHSAGSGKTLTICWLADALHSLYKPGTDDKLVDIVFILTDRITLDDNIRRDIVNFTQLKDVLGLADRADDLPKYLKQRRPIIVTTQQKFAWISKELRTNRQLRKLRVAFLIDEAHRSQEGQMGAAIRLPFRKPNEPDKEAAAPDPEEQIARIIREHDLNQLFVAFTATPSPATVSLFGKPFDTYSEAEAIAEGYIVDVASSIISYKTLYNLHCPIIPKPNEEKIYPKGVVAKALKNVAYQDEGLIQYKAEVMLRIFDEQIKPLIGGRAKAMIVTTSRMAGLRYFNIIREKLKEKESNYKALYAFSDFINTETNEQISEHAINGLRDGELIEDRFEGDDYRLMIVANKFQTGFNQPLLAGMFLDKAVVDRNAVQTVSRLNRSYLGKDKVIVVDFTNNAAAILKAFQKYRKGTPFAPEEPDKALCPKLYKDILAAGVFTQGDADNFVKLAAKKNDAQVQYRVHDLREHFQKRISDPDERKAFVYLLARFVKTYHFLTSFVTYSQQINVFSAFAEYVGPQLIKVGTISDMMKLIRQTEVVKAAVEYRGEVKTKGTIKLKPRAGRKGVSPPPVRVSVQDMITDIRRQFNITDDQALYIKEVTEEKIADSDIRNTVRVHRDDAAYLEGAYRGQVNDKIQTAYENRGRYEELADTKYTDTGGIFDIMAVTVIQSHLSEAA